MAKIFRNYNTLAEYEADTNKPVNTVCFIKDAKVIYVDGVQYSSSKMETIDNIGDSDNIVDKFNELRKGLLKSNLMAARTPHTLIYWTGNSNTISISGTSYIAQADKVNIDGVEYYQLKLDKDLYNNFCKFSNNTFTNLIFKDVDTTSGFTLNEMFHGCKNVKILNLYGFDTSKVTDMNDMFYDCSALTSLNVLGFDTSNVTGMYNVFNNCKSLTSLDLST